MGGQCSSNLKQQYEIIRSLQHPTLGHLKLIRNIHQKSQQNMYKNNQNSNNLSMGGYQPKDGEYIAVKQIVFNTQKQHNEYLIFVKEANLYYNIPTLLKILSYEAPKSNNNMMSQNNSYRCGPTFPVNLYFKYHPNTLAEILKQKRTQLNSIKSHNLTHSPTLNHRHLSPLPKNIKLNDYRTIDKLSTNERRIVNMYYQEVQILRMIDHIIGALYFLNHLEHKHEAVSPENIMIDEQGKFVLIDAIIFQLETNFQIGFQQVWNKNIAKNKSKDKGSQAYRSGLKYLSPELLSNLKNKHTQHRQSSQKAEVFSVGLIALEMCLLQFNILQSKNNFPSILDKMNLRINKSELTKALVEAQSRYSQQLIELISSMLEYDPQRRVNFSTLIDMLSPLLSSNLSEIQKLYNNQSNYQNHINSQGQNLQSSQRQSKQNTQSNEIYTHQLMNKLSQLETSFQKIMNRTIIYENSITLRHQNQIDLNSLSSNRNKIGVDEQAIIEDQKKILGQLKKINIVSKNKSRPSQKLEKAREGKDRREFKGSQLYDLYLTEYETIKKNRFR